MFPGFMASESNYPIIFKQETRKPGQHLRHERAQRTQRPIQRDPGKDQVRLFFCFVLSVFFCGKSSSPFGFRHFRSWIHGFLIKDN
jgi:hypothetical protein